MDRDPLCGLRAANDMVRLSNGPSLAFRRTMPRPEGDRRAGKGDEAGRDDGDRHGRLGRIASSGGQHWAILPDPTERVRVFGNVIAFLRGPLFPSPW